MSTRTERLSDLIRDEVSRLLLREIKDPRIGFVTITGASVSPDLRHARVFVSVLGSPAEREDTLAGLRSAHGFLQRRVAGELRLKHTPTLTFEHDDTLDRAMRISELIDRHSGS